VVAARAETKADANKLAHDELLERLRGRRGPFGSVLKKQ
jgi:hypothetical protein